MIENGSQMTASNKQTTLKFFTQITFKQLKQLFYKHAAKTFAFMEVFKLADDELIKYILSAAPGCYSHK